VKCLGDGAKLLRQRLTCEILNAVLKWIGAGENHRMRWPSKRNLGDGSFEDYAVMRQSVESWSLDHLRAVARHVVGA
jgi:hypothetical protein